MELYEQIRRAREREGLSVRELARRFRVHRRDVRQALASRCRPPRKVAGAGGAGAGSVEADDRRLAGGGPDGAAQAASHGSAGVAAPGRGARRAGGRVDGAPVRGARSAGGMDVPLVEVMVPQHHPLGDEAEVDFGAVSVYLAGVLVEVSMFVMRLSASGEAFAAGVSERGPGGVPRWSRPGVRALRWGARPDPLRQLEGRGRARC